MSDNLISDTLRFNLLGLLQVWLDHISCHCIFDLCIYIIYTMLYGVVFSPSPKYRSVHTRTEHEKQLNTSHLNQQPIRSIQKPQKKTSKNHKTGYLPWFTTKKMGLSNTLSILSHLYPMRHVSAMAPRPWASKKTTSGISSESSWISGFSRAQGKHNSWARPRNLWNQWFLCGSAIYI